MVVLEWALCMPTRNVTSYVWGDASSLYQSRNMEDMTRDSIPTEPQHRSELGSLRQCI